MAKFAISIEPSVEELTYSEISFEIGDDSIIDYVGSTREEGEESFVLTALSEGTTTLTATVEDTDMYEGGAQIVLTVTVN